MAGANPEALGAVLPVQAGSRSALVLPGDEIGDVLYWDGTAWVPLPPGLDGFQLTTHDVGFPPTWEAGTVAPVASVFGRVGAVVAVAGDYSFPLISGVISAAQHDNQPGGALHALATALAAGFMSPADFTKLAGISTGASTAILGWGSNSVGSTVATRYLEPWFGDNLAPTTPTQWRAVRPGTAKNARVRHNGTAGNGNAIVYTLRKEGVATALTVSLASTASDGSDLVNTVAFAAGDRLDIEITKAAAIGASPTNVVWEMEFAA